MGGHPMDSERFETVVIGGGQAGLATGYHLAWLGRPFVILDAGQRVGDPGGPAGTRCACSPPPRYSGCRAWASRRRPGTTPPRTRWPSTWRTTRPGSTPGPQRRPGRLAHPAGGPVPGHRRGCRFEAANVVVASGAYHHPRVPGFAPSSTRASSSSTPAATGAPPSSAKAALVVGAANSGAEIASSLSGPSGPGCRAGTRAASRPGRGRLDRLLTPPFWFFISHVLTVDTPIGRKVRPKLIRAGTPLDPGQAPGTSAAGSSGCPHGRGPRRPALLEDGRVLRWPTSSGAPVRPDFSWIDLPVDADGQPRHDRGVVAGQASLYFVGSSSLPRSPRPWSAGSAATPRDRRRTRRPRPAGSRAGVQDGNGGRRGTPGATAAGTWPLHEIEPLLLALMVPWPG